MIRLCTFIGVICGLAFKAQASPSVTFESVLQWKNEEIHQFFPELEKYTVQLVFFKNHTNYFQSNVTRYTALNPPQNRIYQVMVSESLFKDPPSESAIRAILVHELKHILDYTKMSGLELATFALGYVVHPSSEYERATDLYALLSGQAEGLKAYREWLYQHVSEEDRLMKRKRYLTPEEIDQWIQDHP